MDKTVGINEKADRKAIRITLASALSLYALYLGNILRSRIQTIQDPGKEIPSLSISAILVIGLVFAAIFAFTGKKKAFMHAFFVTMIVYSSASLVLALINQISVNSIKLLFPVIGWGHLYFIVAKNGLKEYFIKHPGGPANLPDLTERMFWFLGAFAVFAPTAVTLAAGSILLQNLVQPLILAVLLILVRLWMPDELPDPKKIARTGSILVIVFGAILTVVARLSGETKYEADSVDLLRYDRLFDEFYTVRKDYLKEVQVPAAQPFLVGLILIGVGVVLLIVLPIIINAVQKKRQQSNKTPQAPSKDETP